MYEHVLLSGAAGGGGAGAGGHDAGGAGAGGGRAGGELEPRGASAIPICI